MADSPAEGSFYENQKKYLIDEMILFFLIRFKGVNKVTFTIYPNIEQSIYSIINCNFVKKI